MPQVSVPGPILYVIFVNDIDEELTCKITKLTDDMKITSRVTINAEKLQIQSNLDIVIWQKKKKEWLMKFNVDKC